MGIALGDLVPANYGVLAIMAVLHQRDETGRRIHIDISLVEALFCSMTDLVVEQRATGQPRYWGKRHPVLAPQGVFPSLSADEWMALTVGDNA